MTRSAQNVKKCFYSNVKCSATKFSALSFLACSKFLLTDQRALSRIHVERLHPYEKLIFNSCFVSLKRPSHLMTFLFIYLFIYFTTQKLKNMKRNEKVKRKWRGNVRRNHRAYRRRLSRYSAVT